MRVGRRSRDFLFVRKNICTQFKVDRVDIKRQGLESAARARLSLQKSRTTTGKSREKFLYMTYVDLVEEALIAGKHKVAKEAARLTATKGLKDRKYLRALAEELEVETTEAMRAYHRFRKKRDKLKKDSTSPEANLVVGKYLCFIRGDWSRGLPLLAKAGDDRLSAIAEGDLRASQGAAGRMKVADDWYDLSKELDGIARRRVADRAAFLYRMASRTLSGVDAGGADLRWLELSKRRYRLVMNRAVLALTFDGLNENIRRGAVVKDHSGHGDHGQIYGPTVEDGKRGHSLAFDSEKEEYVRGDTPGTGFPFGQAPRSFSAWVKTTRTKGATRTSSESMSMACESSRSRPSCRSKPGPLARGFWARARERASTGLSTTWFFIR